MNILYLHSSSDLYGSDKSLLRTIKSLSNDFSNIVVCLPYDGPLVDRLEDIGVKCYVYKLGVLRRSKLSFFGVFKFIFEFTFALFKTLYICSKNRIDVIHTNTSAVLVGGVASRILKIKHFWHIREIILEPVWVKKILHYFLFNYSTLLIGVSNSVIENIKNDYPNIVDKSIVLHNGLIVEKFLGLDNILEKGMQFRESLNISKGDILVGMIARVSHWKGQDLFLKVAKNLLGNNPNVHFLAVGGPFKGQEDMMEKFRNDAEKLNNSDRFIIKGFIEDVRPVLEAIDIFVLPSTSPDPFPTTVLEAMIMGKAIVGNGHGGITQMLEDGKNGYLVDPNNASEMADKIQNLIDNIDLRQKFERKSKEKFLNNYTFDIYKRNIKRIYNEKILGH